MICSAALAVLFIPTTGKDYAPQADKLERTWVLTSIFQEGKEGKISGGVWFEFTGDTIQWVTFGAGDSFKYRSDPNSKPATIDILDGDGKTVANKGIYKIEKGTLTICLSEAGGDRPKDFSPTKEKRILVLDRTSFVLHR